MKNFLALLLLVFTLTACTTNPTVVKHETDLRIQLKGIRVVFADQPFPPSENTLVNNQEINRYQLRLGEAVIEKVPEKFKEYDLLSAGRSVPADKVTTLKDISSYWIDSPADWHVLIVQPMNAVKYCLGCPYLFAVNLTLIDPITGKTEWRSLLDQPLVNFASLGPRGAYNGFSFKMVEALIAGLQRKPPTEQADKVIK